MPEAVIVATGRTPIGRANKGSLVECRPDDLSALVIKTVLAKVPAVADQIEDVIWGCGQPAGEAGTNVGRVAALLAGIDVPGVTVNRYCSSSLQTIRMAAHAIRAGEGDVFVAGGVETVSRFQFGAADTGPPNPKFEAAHARTKLREAGGQPPWTPNGRVSPTSTSRWVRPPRTCVSRRASAAQEMDEFALRSQQRAVAVAGARVLRARDHPGHARRRHRRHQGRRPPRRHDARAARVAEAGVPARRRGHGGQLVPLNDGAAAVVVMSDTKAKALGITPLARIVASGVSSLDPEIMGLGPIGACRQVLERAGMTIDQIDLVEINEAFAAQVIPSAKQLGIPMEKLNVNGGAIALGHPFGMTGARIMTTLLNGLDDAGKTFGLESMCVGGGQGMAMIVERLA